MDVAQTSPAAKPPQQPFSPGGRPQNGGFGGAALPGGGDELFPGGGGALPPGFMPSGPGAGIVLPPYGSSWGSPPVRVVPLRRPRTHVLSCCTAAESRCKVMQGMHLCWNIAEMMWVPRLGSDSSPSGYAKGN